MFLAFSISIITSLISSVAETARLTIPDGQLKAWASHYFIRLGSLGQLVFDFKHVDGMLYISLYIMYDTEFLIIQNQDYDVARPMASANEYFSISYHACLLYFSRLIRPVWSVKLVNFSEPAMVTVLNSVMENCLNLREFLLQYAQLVY
jgi:hypothetical protein